MNNHGFDDVIAAITENLNTLLITMRGHMGETYVLEVYLSSEQGELCIDDAATNVSIFNVLDFEEYGITKDVLKYFKYGK